MIELYNKGSDLPFGIIGMDEEEKLFVKGLEEDYYLSWLEDGIEDEEGVLWELKDGVKFLETVRDKMLTGVKEDEMVIKGPVTVDMIPELEELKDDGTREIVSEDEDLKESSDEGA
jgi:hypothetical protein